MKNLRMYLASGIPSPSHSKWMAQKPKRIREISDRQVRRAARLAKRNQS